MRVGEWARDDAAFLPAVYMVARFVLNHCSVAVQFDSLGLVGGGLGNCKGAWRELFEDIGAVSVSACQSRNNDPWSEGGSSMCMRTFESLDQRGCLEARGRHMSIRRIL